MKSLLTMAISIFLFIDDLEPNSLAVIPGPGGEVDLERDGFTTARTVYIDEEK